VTTSVERLDLPAAFPRARTRRDTETDTVQFEQAALAAAKQEGLQLAVRARYTQIFPRFAEPNSQAEGTRHEDQIANGGAVAG
jgi:hypothetical protein